METQISQTKNRNLKQLPSHIDTLQQHWGSSINDVRKSCCIFEPIHTHARKHGHKHTHIHTQTRTHTHAHTHIHKHTPDPQPSKLRLPPPNYGSLTSDFQSTHQNSMNLIVMNIPNLEGDDDDKVM